MQDDVRAIRQGQARATNPLTTEEETIMTKVIFNMPNRKPVEKDLSAIKEKKDMKDMLKEAFQDLKDKKQEEKKQ